MIHSLSGGVVRDKKYYDFAKVKIETGEIFWFISKFKELKVGDFVVVPIGKSENLVKGEVLRIDKNISEQVAPIPVKRMKEIVEIIKK